MNLPGHWFRRSAPRDEDAPGGASREALLSAIEDPDPSTLHGLLREGVPADSDRRPGWSVLPKAAFNGHLEHVRLLLGYGADPDRLDAFGMTALQWASWKGNPEMIEALCAAGASVNDAFGPESAPLMLAAQEGHTECVRALLRYGANPRPIDSPDAEPVCIAEAARKASRPEAAELIAAHIRQAETALRGGWQAKGPAACSVTL